MSISDRLDEITARANAATDGSWAAWPDQDGADHMQGLLMVGNAAAVIPKGESWVEGVDVNPIAHTYCEEDRQFIAHAKDDVPELVEAVRRRDAALRAVLGLHKPVEVPVISGACAAEECDHEDACPTHPLSVCGGCMERAEEVYPYATENGEAMARLVYPCDDVRAVTAALGEA